jgi:hypothetical protein
LIASAVTSQIGGDREIDPERLAQPDRVRDRVLHQEAPRQTEDHAPHAGARGDLPEPVERPQVAFAEQRAIGFRGLVVEKTRDVAPIRLDRASEPPRALAAAEDQRTARISRPAPRESKPLVDHGPSSRSGFGRARAIVFPLALRVRR